MTWKTRLVMRESTFTAVAFTAAVFYLIAFWDVQDHFTEGPLRDYLTSRVVHVELLLAGILYAGNQETVNFLMIFDFESKNRISENC